MTTVLFHQKCWCSGYQLVIIAYIYVYVQCACAQVRAFVHMFAWVLQRSTRPGDGQGQHLYALHIFRNYHRHTLQDGDTKHRARIAFQIFGWKCELLRSDGRRPVNNPVPPRSTDSPRGKHVSAPRLSTSDDHYQVFLKVGLFTRAFPHKLPRP